MASIDFVSFHSILDEGSCPNRYSDCHSEFGSSEDKFWLKLVFQVELSPHFCLVFITKNQEVYLYILQYIIKKNKLKKKW